MTILIGVGLYLGLLVIVLSLLFALECWMKHWERVYAKKCAVREIRGGSRASKTIGLSEVPQFLREYEERCRDNRFTCRVQFLSNKTGEAVETKDWHNCKTCMNGCATLVKLFIDADPESQYFCIRIGNPE